MWDAWKIQDFLDSAAYQSERRRDFGRPKKRLRDYSNK